MSRGFKTVSGGSRGLSKDSNHMKRLKGLRSKGFMNVQVLGRIRRFQGYLEIFTEFWGVIEGFSRIQRV